MFEENVKAWLDKNGFSELDVIDDDEFLYDVENQVIYLGIVSTSEGSWFEQFMYEYGLNYIGIVPEVLAFIHELGHHCTINSFNNDDLVQDSRAKSVVEFISYSYNRMSVYWELPTEFAANIWAINFINTHFDAVQELCDIWRIYEGEI